jgi:hypothetical protein
LRERVAVEGDAHLQEDLASRPPPLAEEPFGPLDSEIGGKLVRRIDDGLALDIARERAIGIEAI